MDRQEKRRVVEALILASPEPLSAARIAEIIPYCKPGMAKDLVNELNTEYEEQDRAFEIWEVAGGYQVRTRAEFSGYLQRLQKVRPLRLSRAALETLSVIVQKGWFKYTKRRFGEGRRFFRMAPIHHHFEKLGWSETKVVNRFWILGVLFAMVALSTLKVR